MKKQVSELAQGKVVADKRITELQGVAAKDALDLAALRAKVEELTAMLATSRGECGWTDGWIISDVN